MANDMVEEVGGLARQVLAGTEPGRRFVGQEVFEYVCDGIRAAREPLLKRIEELLAYKTELEEAIEAFERELDERLLSASSRESALLMDLKVAVRVLAKEEG